MRSRSSCSRRLAYLAKGRGDAQLRLGETGPGIEDREVLIRVQKLLVLVLSMELDQPVRQVLERGGRGQRARDEGAAPALCGDFASNDQVGGLARDFEDRFDGGEVLAGAHQVGRRTAAQQEADGLDEDGLAGPGFARQDVERMFKLDRDRLDDRQVADGKVAQHRRGGEGMPVAESPIVSWV